MSFKDRLKTAYKAHSVQILAVLASQSVWYPFVRPFAEAVLGPDKAEAATTVALAVLGVLGYAKPQKSLETTR